MWDVVHVQVCINDHPAKFLAGADRSTDIFFCVSPTRQWTLVDVIYQCCPKIDMDRGSKSRGLYFCSHGALVCFISAAEVITELSVQQWFRFSVLASVCLRCIVSTWVEGESIGDCVLGALSM